MQREPHSHSHLQRFATSHSPAECCLALGSLLIVGLEDLFSAPEPGDVLPPSVLPLGVLPSSSVTTCAQVCVHVCVRVWVTKNERM